MVAANDSTSVKLAPAPPKRLFVTLYSLVSLARFKAHLPEHSLRDLAIIKRDGLLLQDLVGLVSFACQNHDIALVRGLQRLANGYFAINFGEIGVAGFLQAHDHVIHNR